MNEDLSYEKAGVNIDVADATKKAMGASMDADDPRVFNRIGAYASLVDGSFPGYEHPVLALKTEEPGSKQKLAVKYERISSICYDMVNHLIDDIIVMGAEPVYVQDCIICGRIEQEVATELVASIAAACREQGCTLVGGELSEQPGVVEAGVYILSASIVGVVERAHIVDGSAIKEGDVVLAVASNGLHTNGYSLVRALIDQDPRLVDSQVDGESFIDCILRPHKCYWQALKGMRKDAGVHGMAHITGGGVQGNLSRILPPGTSAAISLDAIRIPSIFALLRDAGGVSEADMLRTFNMGVGMTLVVAAESAEAVSTHLRDRDCDAYAIGEITAGDKDVKFSGDLKWPARPGG